MNATAGNWFVAKAFGNPIPDLFAGPVGSPSVSDLTITKDGGGTFDFSQADLASNNGDSRYTYSGFLGATMEFANSGGIPSNVGFATYANPDTLTLIDRLVISIDPTGQPTSMNVDNIVLTTNVIPSPRRLRWLASPPCSRLGIGCGVAGGPPDQIGDEDARSPGDHATIALTIFPALLRAGKCSTTLPTAMPFPVPSFKSA